jgi:hypothetical protein
MKIEGKACPVPPVVEKKNPISWCELFAQSRLPTKNKQAVEEEIPVPSLCAIIIPRENEK